MKRNAKVDKNQPDVVYQLRKMGFLVMHTHQLKNCCDFFIMREHFWCPVELKNDEDMPKKFWSMNAHDQDKYLDRKLTDGEKDFKDMCEAHKAPYILDCTADRIAHKFKQLFTRRKPKK